jgi:hypothetical protein
MAPHDQRRLPRITLGLPIRIDRGDGTAANGICVDASDEVFAVTADNQLSVGEFVRLRIGKQGRVFVAQVVWHKEQRFGLRCLPHA